MARDASGPKLGLRLPLCRFAVAVLAMTPCADAAEELVYVKTRDGQKAKPRVVADNACAWPNLTVLRDGTIVATIFNAPYHANIVGDVECWGSSDNGLTWDKYGTPAPHDPPSSNRMNVAAGVAKNGDLIVISSGWLLKLKPPPPPGQLHKASLVRVLPAWVCRSTDRGRTWSVDRKAMPAVGPLGSDACPPVPFGDITEGADGTLRVAAYSCIHWRDRERRYWRSYVYRSRDDGRTWGEPVCISDERSHNETALYHLGNGKWLAAARGGGLKLYASADDGNTWEYRLQLRANGYPGHIMRLRTGRLILSVGTRSGTERTTRVFYSDDEGRTWSPPFRVVDYIGKDGGYPSSIELPDGQVLTAYYAKEIKGHPRYHLGIVIWDPTKTFAAAGGQ